MISANGGLPAHRYTPQVTPRWPRGSEPASNLHRLLSDVVLTTIFLHKRHAVPILPLAGNYLPQKGGSVGKTLVNDPLPEWYQ